MILHSPSNKVGNCVITFRRKLSIVFPHMAKVFPLKQLQDHKIKPIDIDTVLLERIEPSHIIASLSLYLSVCHHVIVSNDLGLNTAYFIFVYPFHKLYTVLHFFNQVVFSGFLRLITIEHTQVPSYLFQCV